MEATIPINKQAVQHLVRVKEEFDASIDSLELMADNEFMESYAQAKKQIEKRELTVFDEL